MFQNLQTWHIITIVIVILLIIGAIVYMRLPRKEIGIKIDQNDKEKVLPKLMSTAASLRSKGNLASSTGSQGVETKPTRDPFFYKKLGIALCNKEITNAEEFMKKLKEKFPKDNLEEVLTFYILFSPRLTEEQKKDLIVSTHFENELYYGKVNNYLDNIPYLEGENTVVCKIDKEALCKGKETISLQEYTDIMYNTLSIVFDINKLNEHIRNELIKNGKTGREIKEDGSFTEVRTPYTEQEITQLLKIGSEEFSKHFNAMKTKIDSIYFCNLYLPSSNDEAEVLQGNS